eukprot:12521943-Alexandrium_andersonii.AAC.1
MRRALAAHAERRRPDDRHADPHAKASRDGGFALIVAGVIARVPVADVGTAGLCMCNERSAHVRCG